MMLDKKSYALLSYLLTLDEPETVTRIAHELKQSRRRVYYHLEKINDALPTKADKIIPYPRVGIYLSNEQKEDCSHLLAALDSYSYVMSIEERIQLSLTYIAVSKDRVTIEKLMQLNDVSRNTILNDLNDLRDRLTKDEYDIQLCVNKAQGYYLSCHPLSKIQFLYRLLYTIYTQGNQGFIDIVRNRIIDLTGFGHYFSKAINHYLQEQLSSAQAHLGKTINPQDASFMVQIFPYLILSYRNIDLTEEERQVMMRDFSMTWQRLEYQLACKIATGLSTHFDLYLDKVEVSLIAMLLLSFRKDCDTHLESHEYAEMRRSLERFLNQISHRSGLVFAHQDDLLDRLLTHCKALLYRKTYGILSVNPLTKYIVTTYHDLFAITKACVTILEQAWLITMTDDDIAYLVIHLGGELERHPVSPKVTKHRVILVCNEGIGVQKLLLSQCQAYLTDCDIEAVFTTEQFDSVRDIVQADMVISTSDALETTLPHLLVHPILSDDDIIKLIRFLKYHGRQGESRFSQDLDKCLQVYVPNQEEREVLKAQIEKLVGQELSGIEA